MTGILRNGERGLYLDVRGNSFLEVMWVGAAGRTISGVVKALGPDIGCFV